jgi:hypothetical protein
MQRIVGLRLELEEDATARQAAQMRALLASMPHKHDNLSSLHIVFPEVGYRDLLDEAVRFHALTYAMHAPTAAVSYCRGILLQSPPSTLGSPVVPPLMKHTHCPQVP